MTGTTKIPGPRVNNFIMISKFLNSNSINMNSNLMKLLKRVNTLCIANYVPVNYKWEEKLIKTETHYNCNKKRLNTVCKLIERTSVRLKELKFCALPTQCEWFGRDWIMVQQQ